MSFNEVLMFEQEIAEFYGAPYAVATDCCTHAIEICLRAEDIREVSVPVNTYISVPFTMKKLGITMSWSEEQWKDYYCIGNTRIIDAAVYWKENGYISNKLMCLSFQYKKHLSLGRGGAILLDDKELYHKLKRMSYDGREPNIPWAEQDISEVGYHYYMTPEVARQGINKLTLAKVSASKQWSWKDYPDLRIMSVFN
tara:strand:+ start:24402 stop:24992 length:591 start_codon:yes stop_codon:yes gene_type:complete